MKLPQHTTHWSAFYPVMHFGPVADCPECATEKLRAIEGVNDERDSDSDSHGDRGVSTGIHRVQP